jgi:hypothetical protein
MTLAKAWAGAWASALTMTPDSDNRPHRFIRQAHPPKGHG